uniref:Uncharacterized protein n=1 Tax=Salix viminalis TaxID=40686 RepID=A0A6N2LJD2_SALVM
MMGHPGQVTMSSLDRCITVVILLALSTDVHYVLFDAWFGSRCQTILWDPFAAALQMVQELKPQFVNLRRQQRELLMKRNDYKNDCTNNILIYRRLASSMKSSTDLTSDLGRLYAYRVIGLVLLAVVFVFVTFFRCIFLSGS